MTLSTSVYSDLRRRYGITEAQRNDPVVCGDDFLLPHAPSKMWCSQIQRIVRRIGTRATPKQLAAGLVSGYEDFTNGGSLRFWKTVPNGHFLVLLTKTERDVFIARRLQYYMEQLQIQQMPTVHHTARHIGQTFRPAFPPQQCYQHQSPVQQLVRLPVNTESNRHGPVAALPIADLARQAEFGRAQQKTAARSFGQQAGTPSSVQQTILGTIPGPSHQGAAPFKYPVPIEQNKLGEHWQREQSGTRNSTQPNPPVHPYIQRGHNDPSHNQGVPSNRASDVGPAEMAITVHNDDQRPKFRTEDKQNSIRVLKLLMAHPNASIVFNEPVKPDELGLPDYFDVIKFPMDLGTIKTKLESDSYVSVKAFEDDVTLTFDNALKYNPKGTEVYLLAKEMKAKFAGLVVNTA